MNLNFWTYLTRHRFLQIFSSLPVANVMIVAWQVLIHLGKEALVSWFTRSETFLIHEGYYSCESICFYQQVGMLSFYHCSLVSHSKLVSSLRFLIVFCSIIEEVWSVWTIDSCLSYNYRRFITRLSDPCHFNITRPDPRVKLTAVSLSIEVVSNRWIVINILITPLTLMLLLNQVTNDLVIKVFNMFPFNALLLVLLLFWLEC